MSSCMGRAAAPVKRVWRGLGARLGRGRRRDTGKLATCYVPVSRGSSDDDAEGDDMDAGVLGRLRKEVRTCEYRDVHVMWEMLSSSNAGGSTAGSGAAVADVAAGEATATARKRRKQAAAWSRLVAYCCAL